MHKQALERARKAAFTCCAAGRSTAGGNQPVQYAFVGSSRFSRVFSKPIGSGGKSPARRHRSSLTSREATASLAVHRTPPRVRPLGKSVGIARLVTRKEAEKRSVAPVALILITIGRAILFIAPGFCGSLRRSGRGQAGKHDCGCETRNNKPHAEPPVGGQLRWATTTRRLRRPTRILHDNHGAMRIPRRFRYASVRTSISSGGRPDALIAIISS